MERDTYPEEFQHDSYAVFEGGFAWLRGTGPMMPEDERRQGGAPGLTEWLYLQWCLFSNWPRT